MRNFEGTVAMLMSAAFSRVRPLLLLLLLLVLPLLTGSTCGTAILFLLPLPLEAKETFQIFKPKSNSQGYGLARVTREELYVCNYTCGHVRF